ncbi:DUF4349 domain-containing protein [Gulosibacter bifidus]|uniref:DUF4349 domain-containing protein n=1 Tax=Gulosibacter bifidus TaxID=272239 RepID=A0ABW5RIK7_9MICO|nr:DUF4349 domain-containing protein [Gulosibacter bifidus]
MAETPRSASTSASARARVTRLLGAVTTALAIIGLVAGCSSGNSHSPGIGAAPDAYERVEEPGGGAAVPEQAAPDSGAGGAQGNQPAIAERAIRVTTDIRIRVENLADATDRLELQVTELAGHFDHRSEEQGSSWASAEFTVRIPADAHDKFVGQIGELGEVKSTQTNAEDVTLEKVDLESRIASLESSIKSLRGMLEKAANTTEMLEIERELGDREAELASLKSQLEVLNDEVSYSTVNITMSTDSSQIEPEATGFWAGLQEGWEDFMKSIDRFIERFGYALPGLVLIGILFVAAWFAGLRKVVARIRNEFAKARRARRNAPATPQSNTGPQSDASGDGTAPANHAEVAATRGAMPPLPEFVPQAEPHRPAAGPAETPTSIRPAPDAGSREPDASADGSASPQ